MTTMLVDNATLAGAGRALYSSCKGVLGAEHAQEYYNRLGLQAQVEDNRSLFELITTLLLVDDLVWEGSSTKDPQVDSSFAPNDPIIGNRAADSGGHEYLAWPYRWFPVFNGLKGNILKATYLYGIDRERLEFAQQASIHWLLGLDGKRRADISSMVEKIPLCYKKPDHPERHQVAIYGEALSDDEVSLALFISRGVFYHACARAENSEGYLPHSYRGVFLQDPVLKAYVDGCSVCGEGMFAVELLNWIDGTMQERARQVASRGIPEGHGMTLGAAFFRGGVSPLTAWDNALKFRDSSSGIALRQNFAYLLELAKKDDKLLLKYEIDQIDKQLINVTASVKGCYLGEPKQEKVFLSLMPSFVGAAFEMLPERLKRSIRRAENLSVSQWSPYQIIFGSYLGLPIKSQRTIN